MAKKKSALKSKSPLRSGGPNNLSSRLSITPRSTITVNIAQSQLGISMSSKKEKNAPTKVAKIDLDKNVYN